MREQELMFAIRKQLAIQETDIIGEALSKCCRMVLDSCTSPDANYLLGPDDIYVADLESPEIGRALIETNVIGVLNTVYAVLQRMIERRAGQIAIVSSLAGLTPIPRRSQLWRKQIGGSKFRAGASRVSSREWGEN